MDNFALVKGAGELASAVGRRLFLCGFRVVMTELPEPTAIRRMVSFSEAVYENGAVVQGVSGRLVQDVNEIGGVWEQDSIAVVVDPEAKRVRGLSPAVTVDARMAKRNLGTQLAESPVVVGLGPGFQAGRDVHAVVETNRGHHLGRVLYSGAAEPDTGVPGGINGIALERLLRSPGDGPFRALTKIGEMVREGQVVAEVDGADIHSQTQGILRGILRDGHIVSKGMKVGDVDPRGNRDYCFTVSDKANAVAGGVLEAVFHLLSERQGPT